MGTPALALPFMRALRLDRSDVFRPDEGIHDVAMHEMQHLMSTLIDQGAIYPFAPSAVGHSPASSFGTLHAPVFAALKAGTFSHLQVEAVLEAPAGASIVAEAMFRQHVVGSNRPVERGATAHLPSLDLKKPMLADAAILCGAGTGPVLEGTLHLSALHLGGRFWRVQARLRNDTPLLRGTGAMGPSESDAHAFHAAHVLLQATGGHFHSPLAREGRAGALVQACRNENCMPAIASPDDEILLGAALVPREKAGRRGPENPFDRAELDELHG